jgi:hypothetical protein
MAISILYNPMPQRIFEADGDFAAGALAYFYLARTTTPLAVYTDATLSTPHTHPVVADAYGLLAPIYIPKGTEYKVRIEDADGNILYAADGIDNPAEPTGGEGGGGGGGGGLVITADQIYKTGDFSWQPTTADRAGWVRSNGLTISSAVGLGDSRNDLYQSLFIFLWNAFPNTLCAVSAGRGTNAGVDWDAAKTIATLDMRGYGIAGLDDMGAARANRVQVSVNLGTTNTSTTANVTSSVGLCAGMFIVCPTLVSAGTKIAAVVGPTTITLSAPAIATSSSTAARFSIFQDALAAGSGGGENAHFQLASEVGSHTHPLQYGPGYHVGLNGGPGYTQLGYRLGYTFNDLEFARDEFFAVAQTTATQRSNLWTPTRLGTWFVKV